MILLKGGVNPPQLIEMSILRAIFSTKSPDQQHLELELEYFLQLQLPAANGQLPNYPLPAAYCPLPTTHCLLLTAYCPLPLPTAYCPLPTAHCLLPTATANCLLPRLLSLSAMPFLALHPVHLHVKTRLTCFLNLLFNNAGILLTLNR